MPWGHLLASLCQSLRRHTGIGSGYRAGLSPSGGLMHQLRLWGKAEPIGSAFMIRRADGPGAAHRGRFYDQLRLWEGQGTIRMPDQIRDADGLAPIDKFCLSFRLIASDSQLQEPLSSTNVLSRENDSHSQPHGGKSSRGPDTPLAGS
jgi:hypothetical protein